MQFEHSAKVKGLQERLQGFMDAHIYPNEATYVAQQDRADRWQPVPVVEELKPKAQEAGLWNLFLPHSGRGAGLNNLEYAPLAEIMGAVSWSSEVFNCSAPDTGNMETLDRYGTSAQKEEWLEPLLEGEIRSAFCMTEPEVASSDATNIQCRIERDGEGYVVNGRKWWSSGANDPRCKLLIVMGKTAPDSPDRHRQQSMVLVPRDAPGVTVLRHLPVFGYDDAPHGHAEVLFEDVRVPAGNMLLGEGRGFEIAQGRLGPGRIHHCMRAIGMAERALEMTCKRALSRRPFGKPLADQGVMIERIAESRIRIDPVPAAGAARGVAHGRGGQQGGQARDRRDQGRGAGDGVPGDRLGDPGPRRRRGDGGLRPGGDVQAGADVADRRWAGRGAPAPARAVGTGQVQA